MNDIEWKLTLLRSLANYYQDIYVQKELYKSLINDLRKLFASNRRSFTAEIITEINQLKGKIENSKGSTYFINDWRINTDNANQSLGEGIVVLHKRQLYVGVIACKTVRKDLFENKLDCEEYRIQISFKEDKIASPENLIVLGSYIKGEIDIQYKLPSTKIRYAIEHDGTVTVI